MGTAWRETETKRKKGKISSEEKEIKINLFWGRGRGEVEGSLYGIMTGFKQKKPERMRKDG